MGKLFLNLIPFVDVVHSLEMPNVEILNLMNIIILTFLLAINGATFFTTSAAHNDLKCTV